MAGGWQGNTTGQGSTRATREAANKCIANARYRCQLQHRGCTGRATEAHHPDGLADTSRPRSDAIDSSALVAACPWCHGIETQQQARRGRNRWKRQPEKHSGYL